MTPSYVYVLGIAGGDAIKVGFSRCPKTRLGTLRWSTGLELVPRAAYCIRGVKAYTVEQQAHLAMQDYAIGGEFFRVDAATACRLIEHAARIHGAEAVRDDTIFGRNAPVLKRLKPRVQPTTSARQVAGARAMLGWTQVELAQRAGVGESTVRDYEAGRKTPRRENLEKIARAFEKAGMRPLHADAWGGEGVRFMK